MPQQIWQLELPAAARDPYRLARPNSPAAERVTTDAGNVVVWHNVPQDVTVVNGSLPAILAWLIKVTDEELALQLWQDAAVEERIFVG